MNFHQRLDAVLRIRLCKIPVEIILPKDARITFVREDERIRQELVIDDRTIADNVVILHERDSLFGPAPHQDSGGSQSSHGVNPGDFNSYGSRRGNHASFDNVTFVDDRDTILVTEDRGDGLHDQLNKLDSIWAYKLNREHPERSLAARFVALGLDRLATDEDNEPTGLHVSEGDATIGGLIGTRVFRTDRARLFFTQQHGENNLFEVSPLD